MHETLEKMDNYQLFKLVRDSEEVTLGSLEAGRILSHRASLGNSTEARKFIENLERQQSEQRFIRRGE